MIDTNIMLSPILAIMISITIFYFIGHCLFSFLRINTYSDNVANAFVKVILGLLLNVFICAVFHTKGNTILWGIPLVGVLCRLNNNENRVSLIKMQQNELLFVFLLIVLSLVLFFFQAKNFYNPPFNNIPHADYEFYGVLGDLMKEHNSESTVFVSNIYSHERAATPYHYLDIWLGVFIGRLFSINMVESLYVVVYPILFALYTIAIVVIARTYTSNLLLQLISLSTLFFFPLAWFDFTISLKELLITPHFLGYYATANPKTEIIALLFAFSFVVYRLNKKNFYLVLMLIPIASSVAAPAVFLSIATIVMFKMIINNREVIQNNIILIGGLMIIAIFILLFYALQPQGVQTGDFSISEFLSSISRKSVMIVKSCIKLFLFLIIFHSPFIIILLISYTENKDAFIAQYTSMKELFIVIFLMCFFGFVISQIFQGIDNATQFYTMMILSLPLLYIVIVISIFSLVQKQLFKMSIIVFIVFLVIYSVININNHPFAKDLCITRKNPYSTDYLSVIQQYSDMQGASFSNSFCPHYMPQTDSIDLRISSIHESLLGRKNTAFYQFACEHRHIKTIDSLQYFFVKKNDIHFLILEKEDNLPKIFIKEVDTIFIDDKTKEHFVLLNR